MECIDSLVWICSGFAALLPALAAAFQAGASEAAVDHSRWQSAFGAMQLAVFEEVVVGRYPDFDGIFVGRLARAGVQADLIWIQPRSDRRCAGPPPDLTTAQRESLRMTGTAGDFHHWGRVTFSIEDFGTRLAGRWSYCDAPAGSGGVWDALRLSAERRTVRPPGT